MSGGIEVRAQLPTHIKSFKVTHNSPFTVELIDDKGRMHKMVQRALLEAVCPGCTLVFYATTTAGLVCPGCCAVPKWTWGKVQLCFVPEEESDFPARNPVVDLTAPPYREDPEGETQG